MKKLLNILLCTILVLTITGCSSNSNTNKKDKVTGYNYKVPGLSISVPTQYANRWKLANLKVKFANGIYTIDYCVDDIQTSKGCDISKVSGKGNYTIKEDKLYLNVTESTTTDVQSNQTETNKVNNSRTCKIVEKNQTIIDCSESGGFIYFRDYVDEEYNKKAECSIFNGKTYIGEAHVDGYYLRNGKWVHDPSTFTIKFSFQNGKVDSTTSGAFRDDSCEKLSETSYILGQRSASYNPANDTFTITIGTVNGIKYGTMNFVIDNNK